MKLFQMPSNLFLMCAGGTGGHVIPALAVARELRNRRHDILFVGTPHGMEARLVAAENFPLVLIEVGALKNVGLRQIGSTLLQLPLATLKVLRLRRPAAVFSMGGYAAGPSVLAALLRRIPVVVMEPNAVPGFTNHWIARLVARALISFPETAAYFPKGKTELSGLPVREQFFAISPKPKEAVFTLLITGGSQGSRTLNEAVRASLRLFQASAWPIRLIHQTGRSNFEQLRDVFAATGLQGEVLPFIEDMPAAFARADLVVCRAGAGAVAELAAAGKPSILVPFPFAADQHQLRNAEAFARAGAARLALDREMTGQKLFDLVTELAADAAGLESMAQAARQFARPGAAQRAADILEELALTGGLRTETIHQGNVF